LNKVKSSGSMTKEWAVNTFSDSYLDAVYVSGNPWINSQSPMEGFKGYKHFKKVIDVWDFGWSNKIGTVPPIALNEVAKIVNSRTIVHYMQPHAPFVPRRLNGESEALFEKVIQVLQQLYDYITSSESSSRSVNNPLVGPITDGNEAITFRKRVGRLMLKYLGERGVSKFREMVGLPEGPTWDVMHRHGVERVREYYKDNLRYVLSSLSNLVSEIDGKIVVTADHGEYLGENPNKKDIVQVRQEMNDVKLGSELTWLNGEFVCHGHPKFSDSPILREVPWLEVDGVVR